MPNSIGGKNAGGAQALRFSDDAQPLGQFGEQTVQLGKAKPRAFDTLREALRTTWLAVKHSFKSFFGQRVSVARPPHVNTAQDAGKVLIHALTRHHVDLLSVVGNLGQLLKLGQFPFDMARQGLTEGAGKVLRQELADLTSMQLWRLYQNLKANPELLNLAQQGTGTFVDKMTGHESEEQLLQAQKAASGIDDTGFVMMSLEEEVTKALTQRGYVAPSLKMKEFSDDHVLRSVVDRIFKLNGDVDLAVKQLKAERRQRTIDFAMSTMPGLLPGLLKEKVQTVRVAKQPEVLKDQVQVDQRLEKGEPKKLEAGRLALEQEQKELSPFEKTSINFYTGKGDSGPCYRQINTWLRNTGKPPQGGDFIKTLAKNLSSGLAKLPDYKGEVYRGTQLTADQLAKYPVGEQLVEPAFTSTSRSIEKGQSYAGDNHGETVPVLFVITSARGKSIEEYSAFRNEQEVLFTAGTAFEVTGRSQDAQGRYVVHMREIDKQDA